MSLVSKLSNIFFSVNRYLLCRPILMLGYVPYPPIPPSTYVCILDCIPTFEVMYVLNGNGFRTSRVALVRNVDHTSLPPACSRLISNSILLLRDPESCRFLLYITSLLPSIPSSWRLACPFVGVACCAAIMLGPGPQKPTGSKVGWHYRNSFRTKRQASTELYR